jgi:hypothetical protein
MMLAKIGVMRGAQHRGVVREFIPGLAQPSSDDARKTSRKNEDFLRKTTA